MIMRNVVPNMAKDPLRDFRSRHGINVILPFAPTVAAMGSASVNTIMAKMKVMGLSHQREDRINTAKGK